MLGNHRAYATIPASDIDRAKRWYEEKLAFKPSVEEDFGSIYQTADGTIFFCSTRLSMPGKRRTPS